MDPIAWLMLCIINAIVAAPTAQSSRGDVLCVRY